jgi:sterol desaturase/sphingolipid hydroxylase (fatty acid hydroxylase superfamily)
MLDSLQLVFTKMLAIYATQIPEMLALAALFTLLACFESQASSPGRVWWRNPGLATDITYGLVHGVIGGYFRIPALIIVTFVLSRSMTPEQVSDYFANGRGPCSTWPYWAQAIVYVVGADFLLYWIHRVMHGATLWRFHAVHHSATQVDWTTQYRFHPVNLMLQSGFVGVIMVSLGISPVVMAFFVPFDVLSAALVHANVNWTFGPLRYIIATPVFHRWHHGPADDGGSSNFAPTFAFWDVLFGTFHMPEGRLPQTFGTDDHHFPEGYLRQLIYPFKKQPSADTAPAAIDTAGKPV